MLFVILAESCNAAVTGDKDTLELAVPRWEEGIQKCRSTH